MKTKPYNMIKVAKTPRKIKDRGIRWEESYKEKSQNLKDRFDSQIGPGSYHRWEGHDYYTDSDYFIVVGPATTRNGDKRFFVGIKKLPNDPEDKQYAPDGEYFSNIKSAISHAVDKWGINFPKNQQPYGEAMLADVEIPRRLKG